MENGEGGDMLDIPAVYNLTRYIIICEVSHDFWDDIIALWEFKHSHQLGLDQCALLVLLNLSNAYGDGQKIYKKCCFQKFR